MRRGCGWSRVVVAPLLVALALVPCSAGPAKRPGDGLTLGVLEVRAGNSGLDESQLTSITDWVRGAARRALPGAAIMTRERVNQLIVTNPQVFERCSARGCELEWGRALGADLLVTGGVTRFGKRLTVTLRMHDTRRGTFLGEETATAESLEPLPERVQQSALRLFASVGGRDTPPPPPGGGGGPARVEELGAILPEVGNLRVEGSPRGARVDVRGPEGFGDGGAVATTLPYDAVGVPAGVYGVTVSAPGYDEERRQESVLSDRTALVQVELVLSSGTLEVRGTPPGARVDLSCAGGFTKVFGLPGKLTVPRGRCAVKVTRSGYVDFTGSADVAGGATAAVDVSLHEVAAGGTAGTAGIEWIRIPGGTFEMGSTEGSSDEKPVHRVRVEGFELAKSEVTVAQYRACVRAGTCTEPGSGSSCNWGKSGRDDHPVNCVDWEQAVAFSRWAGGRLPSEAEWEYAARSGGRSQRYPWGDEQASCARAVMDDGGNGCGQGGTWAVCSKARGLSAQGVCDLAGNVWEWVEDCWHGDYSGAPSDGRAWTSGCTGSDRVSRGGSWYDTARNLRAASRNGFSPGNRGDNLGFRPLRSIP